MAITCSSPTANHASGHSLLNTYDTERDGTITMSEMMAALDDLKAGKITKEESDYVTACWKLGVGGIDKMCPPRRPPCGDYGDIDGDGYVTLKDAEYLTKYVAEIPGYTLTEDQKRRANVTGDGKITVVNGMLIANYAAGIYNTFPVCEAAPPTPPPECKEGDKKPGYVCEGGKWRKVTVIEPMIEPAAKVAAKRLTYKEALVWIDAGLPVYIKFDIPVLDQIPGIRWGLWMPVLPGFVLTTEP